MTLSVGIVCWHAVGGSSKVAYMKANILAQQYGLDVHVITMCKPWFARNLYKKVKLHYMYESEQLFMEPEQAFYNQSSMEFTPFVLNTVKEHKIMVLHGHYALFCIKVLSALKRALPSIKVILTVHGTDVTDNQRAVEHIAAHLQDIDKVTAVSQYLAQKVHSCYKPNKDVRVIYNFTDIPVKYPKEVMHNTMIHVSNLRPVKKVDTVIRVFQSLAQTTEDLQLLIVGDGPQKNDMKNLVMQYGLVDRVVFHGFCNNIAHILKKADFMILSSQMESFSLAALEAITCGLPVIAPNVGGLPEVIANESSGYLYEPDMIGEAVNYAENLLFNPELYKAMSMSAIQNARKFNKERQVGQYLKLYLD